MDLKIKRLTPEIKDDYLHFFDEVAFCDNPSWSECYCSHFYFSESEDLENYTGTQPRDLVMERLACGKHHGFIAYIDDKPVGWVNTNNKTHYIRITENKEIGYDENQKIGSIVCFVIDHKNRGKGIATALLKEACNYFEALDYDAVEAYPINAPRNEAENYHGPMKMYLKYGFEVKKELELISVLEKKLK